MFEIPKNDTPLTKEFILKNISEENIMRHYLGISVQKGLVVSPLRSDKNPTASFYRNSKGELIFKDFGSNFYGNCIAVVMHIHDCSFYKALKIIANDFDLIKFNNYVTNPPKLKHTTETFKEVSDTYINIESQPFTEKELSWWNMFGISQHTLNKYKVFSCKTVFLNNCYFTSSSEKNPIFGYFGGLKNNKELWRIYMPKKIKYRFLSNWSFKIIQGVKQLPKQSNYLVITKSLKDVMCLYEMGIAAIAPCSENSFVSEVQYNKLKTKFKNIFLLYDTDLPGIKYTKKVRKLFPDINVILIPRKYKCKDLTDLVKKIGFYKTLDIVTDFKNKFDEKTKHSSSPTRD